MTAPRVGGCLFKEPPGTNGNLQPQTEMLAKFEIDEDPENGVAMLGLQVGSSSAARMAAWTLVSANTSPVINWDDVDSSPEMTGFVSIS